MPSFTSSSDMPQHRAPNRNWLLVWGMTIAVTAIVVCGLECCWRRQGKLPTVVDNKNLWAFHRSSLTGIQRDVACLGNSRMVCGFDTELFRRKYPHYNLRQLAVPGKPPIATLADLANDEAFHGLVICDVQCSGLTKRSWKIQQDYVDHYRNSFGVANAVECYLTMNIQDRLSILNPNYRLDKLMLQFAFKKGPSTTILHSMKQDRRRVDDYHTYDEITRRRKNTFIKNSRIMAESTPRNPDAWFKNFMEIEKLVQRIHSRGGQVVFVRFPTDGLKWHYDQIAYPKAQFWDRMAAYTSAETIHFADYPALSRFQLPDTSHLDSADVPAFTEALLEILKDRKILTEK